MLGGVVERLFEDEVGLAALLRSEVERGHFGWEADVDGDRLRLEERRGEVTRAQQQAADIVAARIDRPDAVAQRVHQTARAFGNLVQDRLALRHGRLALGDFAENRDPREARAEVVVEIGGHASADALHGDEVRHALAVRDRAWPPSGTGSSPGLSATTTAWS